LIAAVTDFLPFASDLMPADCGEYCYDLLYGEAGSD